MFRTILQSYHLLLVFLLQDRNARAVSGPIMPATLVLRICTALTAIRHAMSHSRLHMLQSFRDARRIIFPAQELSQRGKPNLLLFDPVPIGNNTK